MHKECATMPDYERCSECRQKPFTPDFASWERETLNDFAAQAYLKLKEQRELIQQLRQLIATVPHDQTPTRKTD